MTQSGSKGFGMKKHGKTGWKSGTGKSPKMRHALKREAEKNEIKTRKTTTKFVENMKELFN